MPNPPTATRIPLLGTQSCFDVFLKRIAKGTPLLLSLRLGLESQIEVGEVALDFFGPLIVLEFPDEWLNVVIICLSGLVQGDDENVKHIAALNVFQSSGGKLGIVGT